MADFKSLTNIFVFPYTARITDMGVLRSTLSLSKRDHSISDIVKSESSIPTLKGSALMFTAKGNDMFVDSFLIPELLEKAGHHVTVTNRFLYFQERDLKICDLVLSCPPNQQTDVDADPIFY